MNQFLDQALSNIATVWEMTERLTEIIRKFLPAIQPNQQFPQSQDVFFRTLIMLQYFKLQLGVRIDSGILQKSFFNDGALR